jgi:hypothetical protein
VPAGRAEAVAQRSERLSAQALSACSAAERIGCDRAGLFVGVEPQGDLVPSDLDRPACPAVGKGEGVADSVLAIICHWGGIGGLAVLDPLGEASAKAPG